MSTNITNSPREASIPTLRGLPDQPEFSWWMTLKRGSSAASASSRAGVSSVEPSSTKITSYCVGRAATAASSDATQSSMYGPGLYTGTMTLTLTGIGLGAPSWLDPCFRCDGTVRAA